MKNSVVKYSSLLFLSALVACKDKSAFTLSGTISHPDKVKKVYLLQADSTQISVVDSTSLSEDGQFKFQHQAPYANLFKLRAGGVTFDLIAKNGDDVTFKTDLQDQKHEYVITGSDESDKIKQFNALSNVYIDKNAKLAEEYEAKAQQNGNKDSLINYYQPIFKKNMNDYGTAVWKFVNDNKNSLAGFYAALSLDQNQYESQLVQYADDIKGEFKDNLSVQKFKQQMAAVKPVSVGQKAPEFTVGGVDGKPVKLSDYKGKYVMIDFWASWCMPCRQENPNVVKLYNQYKDKGLNILGISLDEKKANWQQAITADKLTWQHASDLKNFEGPTERLYHIEAIPSNFIIDPQGKIIAKNVTGADLESFLKKTFPKS
ncbi:AhpC/TSA family protein [Mucilaginibacter robiniae]|uniref:AhpC/TSA family protein n=1 Tax=Mucilaginibacter robiniae TaxID=2728022 RepID=A0A7L5EAB3_9SPHI|nr:TlpA disulfide reductase family protein [Mucilaginibacter robiniae]QJD97853.1 AhpC/TSA family protein [Mucilaginibacter robiniae]